MSSLVDYSNQRLSLPIHLEYNLADVNGSSFIGFIPVNYNKVLSTNNYTDEAYKMYHSNGTYYGQMPTQWTPGATTQNVGDFFEIDININEQIFNDLDLNELVLDPERFGIDKADIFNPEIVDIEWEKAASSEISGNFRHARATNENKRESELPSLGF